MCPCVLNYLVTSYKDFPMEAVRFLWPHSSSSSLLIHPRKVTSRGLGYLGSHVRRLGCSSWLPAFHTPRDPPSVAIWNMNSKWKIPLSLPYSFSVSPSVFQINKEIDLSRIVSLRSCKNFVDAPLSTVFRHYSSLVE